MTARVRRTASIPLFLVLISSGFDCRHATEPLQTRAGSDTTSHDFFWRVDTLGAGSANVLRDVAVVNDTVAYAVGAIYEQGSSYPYNAAVWNGKEWTPTKLSWLDRGFLITPRLESVLAFSPTDIWLSSGIPVHGNGTTWTPYNLFDMGILTPADGSLAKAWGTNSSNIYFVGNRGTVVYYNGSTWQKLSSGTDVDLLDVYGTPDGNTVWACGVEDFKPSTVLRIRGTRVEKIYENADFTHVSSDSMSGVLTSLCCPSGSYLFVSSNSGLYQCPPETRGEGRRISSTSGYFHRVRGMSDVDLFVAGHYNFLSHYNGANWHQYAELASPDGWFNSVDSRGNTVVAVGSLYNGPTDVHAVIVIGRR